MRERADTVVGSLILSEHKCKQALTNDYRIPQGMPSCIAVIPNALPRNSVGGVKPTRKICNY